MLKDRFASLVALTLASAGSAAFAVPLAAQGAQAGPETVQLAFGYECDDRFLIRNDGGRAVDVEYNVQGVSERSRLHLDPRQSVEISSTSRTPVELWVNGKLAATERKGNRACATTPAAPEVVVRPIEPRDYPGAPDAAAGYPAYPQREVVYAPEPYYYPAYSYYPYYYYPPYYPRYYGGYGASLSVVLPIFTRVGGQTRYYGRPGYGGGRVVHVARPRGGRR